jgi:hypothetical protein
MLGRAKRTSPTDVGLALAFSGLAYLVWALVAHFSRGLVYEMIKSTDHTTLYPAMTRGVKVFFADAGFVIDLVGLVWLIGSLTLVFLAARQRISISWAWVAAISQSFIATLGCVLVATANHGSFQPFVPKPGEGETTLEQVSSISLVATVGVAVVVWCSLLTYFLADLMRYRRRRGPSLGDGMRTNMFR